ncbi:Phosphatidylethanolamine-binding protein 4 [Madurella mycetomatis]|uniref:Phosphatidylethanolamine-binding protein 4 n=1 Tax=Madurella mycetomatis TaxID=100816 RepID=A0A175VS38_9PEZI|nr:Phosphatidylethanolamine-binding protein 4 [Madurella mycetomatis]KXX76288.1 Phosphatidylethanolamine-binding protein 4 [Madurella mycetomatis]
MFFSPVTLIPALFLTGLASAQTPEGFAPEVTAKLDIIFGTKAVDTPGASFTRAETARQPIIGTSDAPLTGTYLWMMIDLDVPANFQNPSAGPRRTNLHALITGFTPAATATTDGVYVLNPPASSSAGPVPYVGPAPPPENPPHAHRYVSLLYETPADFSVSRTQVGQTFGFDLARFVEAVGLETPPVRAGYFNVTG